MRFAGVTALLALLAPPLHAFQPHSLVKTTRYKHGRSFILWEASNGNDESDNFSSSDGNNDESNKAVGRAGGRRRRLFGASQPKQRGSGWSGLVPAVVLFSLLLIFVPIFGGGSESSPSVYYYQSSSFESRIYSSDGSVQTTRKESVQTNMPSLLEGNRLIEDRRVITEGYARPSIEHDDF